VISGGRFCRQPLKKQQIEFRRLTGQPGQHRMDLPAVVGLVIEPMRQRRRQLLLEWLGRGDAAVSDRPRDSCVIEAIDKIDDPAILDLARGTKFVECLEQDRIQPARCVAQLGEPLLQIRSVTSRWFKVPWTDLKKAPRSARYCSGESRAAAA
jgi:hypothetical protein